jgi:hypothetical protein
MNTRRIFSENPKNKLIIIEKNTENFLVQREKPDLNIPVICHLFDYFIKFYFKKGQIDITRALFLPGVDMRCERK